MREAVGGLLMLLGRVFAVAGLFVFGAARVLGGPLGGNDVLAAAAVVIGVLFITACVHQLGDAEPIEAAPPDRKRRWYQFSLRTLLIGATLLAVVCGYVAREFEFVHVRRTWLNEHPKLPFFGGSHIFGVLVRGDEIKSTSIVRKWLGDRELREWEVFCQRTSRPIKRN